jgi:hypothetical protein
MMPDDRAPDLPETPPDALSPAQARRFKLWRAMSDLANAQADGRLTPEQVRVLEALAENLQDLAGRLSQLAELGQQYAQMLEAGRTSQAPTRTLPPGPAAD